eukprot:3002389-Alexandrium_andersonii.AAC.1
MCIRDRSSRETGGAGPLSGPATSDLPPNRQSAPRGRLKRLQAIFRASRKQRAERSELHIDPPESACNSAYN